ncbi:MAG: HD domain-containing protein [Clostridia bacterium]|nr:HD domain-containing protein [Clostridia bacterium]
MDFVKALDEIILSENVVERFYEKFGTDSGFSAWIDNIIPQLRKCENQKQNNPWHKYNVLRHILHSVKEMNKQTKARCFDFKTRRLLAYVMLFHDIGKPDKHIVREKNGKKIDSFFDHNVKSSEIAQEILPKLGFEEKEVAIMLKLIFKHDIFMFIKLYKTNNPYWKVLTKELVEEEIQDLNQVGDGKLLLEWLILVGRSDNLAQNEKMTVESLQMLDKFEKMLTAMQ